MADGLSQEELERLVVGEPPEPRVSFFEKAIINPEKSRLAGHRVYDKHVMIKRTQPGVTDWVPTKATLADIRRYQREFDIFTNQRQGTSKPGIEIIPGVDIAHLQELRDMGLGTVEALAAAIQVPRHLEHIRVSAVALSIALKELQHEQESEGGVEGGRQVDIGGLRGREIPAGDRGGSEAAGGAGPGGQVDRGEGGSPSRAPAAPGQDRERGVVPKAISAHGVRIRL